MLDTTLLGHYTTNNGRKKVESGRVMEKRLKNYLAYMEKLTGQGEDLSGRDAAGILSGLLVQIRFFSTRGWYT